LAGGTPQVVDDTVVPRRHHDGAVPHRGAEAAQVALHDLAARKRQRLKRDEHREQKRRRDEHDVRRARQGP
jgi:hypothetical protein